jgi:hypothetical protein
MRQVAYNYYTYLTLQKSCIKNLKWLVKKGATMIKVGTAIFEKKIHKESYYWNEQSHSYL